MRIAVLTNDDPQHARGGAGRIAGLQIEMLRTAGHEVRVWCPKILWLEESKWRRLYHHLKDLCARSNIVAEIRDWKPDVLVTHNLTGCGFGSPSAIQSREVRWIHVLHDVQLFEPSGKVYDAMRITFWQRLWSCLRRRYFGTPNLVLSPTQWLMIEHQRRGFFLHTQTEVLPNPAPPVEFVSR
ncbi:MAG: glycosyltransferase, partial [Candidatus Uhrbacteria bacterium]|nr:glycosyltransferase [Candidatus Uhrbacteria bacterium]